MTMPWYSTPEGAQQIAQSMGLSGAPSTPAAAPPRVASAPPMSSSAYSPQAGFGFTTQEMTAAQQTHIAQLTGAQQQQLQQLTGQQNQQLEAMREASAKEISNMQAEQAKQLKQIEIAAQQQQSIIDNQLKAQLASNQITHEEYMQKQTLAQQQTQFAQNLAQTQLAEQHQNELSKLTEQHQNELATAEFTHKKQLEDAGLVLNQEAEARQERALQASLGANPQDWVSYALYKRGLSAPSVNGSGPAPADAAAPTMMNGSPYSAAPAGATDQQAQALATSLFNPGTPPGGYNPALAGTGAMGTTIQAPNTFTRAESGASSTSDLGMLSGLLKAGVNIGGQQTSIDPTDYFQQAQNSWVPTLADQGSAKTAYS